MIQRLLGSLSVYRINSEGNIISFTSAWTPAGFFSWRSVLHYVFLAFEGMSGCLGNQSSVIAGKGGGEGGVEDCRGTRGF